jgi:hypothetical protein
MMNLGLGVTGWRGSGGGGAPDPVAEFLALISGDTDAGFFDFTNATAPGSLFTAVDENGGNSFVAPASFQSPGIDATLGMSINATSNRLVSRSQTSGDYDIVFTFVRDAGSTAARAIGNTSHAVYETGSATALPSTVKVDGVTVATRGAFFNALTAGSEVTVIVEGYNATSISLGSVTFAPLGTIRRAAIYSSADRATHQAEAVAAVVAL